MVFDAVLKVAVQKRYANSSQLSVYQVPRISQRRDNQTWPDWSDQMAEWYRAFASGSVDLGFDSESGQTNDFKIGIHSFSA